jgi:hypothetical protein
MRHILTVSISLLTLVLAFLGGSALAPLALAQGAVVPGAGNGYPFVPNADACTAEPRDIDHLLDLWFPAETDPRAGSSISRLPHVIEEIPIGAPADDAVVEAVTGTLHGYFSCLAADDFPRSLTYFTDDMVRQFGPDPFPSRNSVIAYLDANPKPAPMVNPAQIWAITNVMMLDDGRVGSFVIDTGPAGTYTVYVIFELQADGRWLIDEVHTFHED